MDPKEEIVDECHGDTTSVDGQPPSDIPDEEEQQKTDEDEIVIDDGDCTSDCEEHESASEGEHDVRRTFKTTARITREVGHGAARGAAKFVVECSNTRSTAVNVLVKNAKGKPTWWTRFDHPHPGKVNYNHININSKISGVRDPHTRISGAELQAAGVVGKGFETLNKVALPVAISLDIIRLLFNVAKDVQRGTFRNSVKAAASVGGGWAGGFGAAATGAAIGTAVLPGLGTLIGGLIAGVAGGIGGAAGAEAIVDAVGDAKGFDMEWRKCSRCSAKFQVRLYENEGDEKFCVECRKKNWKSED